MSTAEWQDLGAVETLSARPVTAVTVGRLRLAVSHLDGTFGVVHGSCSHAGGPLPVRVRDGRVEADLANGTKRSRRPHEPHPLARHVERTAGPPRILGLSTTNTEPGHERCSTSVALLDHADGS